jgi:membrane protease YdiL (CAAX protease family)
VQPVLPAWKKLSPLPLWQALLLFALTSAAIYAGVYFGIPYLQARGLSFLAAYLICFYPTFVVLFILALFFYRREGNPFTWQVFKERYRLQAVRGRTWLWVAGLFVVGAGGSAALLFTGKWLASFSFFAPPAFLPSEINPLSTPIPGTFFGTAVHGQWGYAVAYFIGWFFNIFGEELLWRGFMLPRQELSYGRWTWLIHGLLWTAWHFFWKWQLISLLPFTLGLSFVVQKTRNTTIGIIVHAALNFIPLIGLVILILQ